MRICGNNWICGAKEHFYAGWVSGEGEVQFIAALDTTS